MDEWLLGKDASALFNSRHLALRRLYFGDDFHSGRQSRGQCKVYAGSPIVGLWTSSRSPCMLLPPWTSLCVQARQRQAPIFPSPVLGSDHRDECEQKHEMKIKSIMIGMFAHSRGQIEVVVDHALD